MVEIVWHRRDNQAATREYKHQPIVSEETGLLDSSGPLMKGFASILVVAIIIMSLGLASYADPQKPFEPDQNVYALKAVGLKGSVATAPLIWQKVAKKK